jgi:hypothetical protein
MINRQTARLNVVRVVPRLGGIVLVACLFITGSVGCARLEPMIEPEVADLQVTADSLKTAVREAQRTVSDLRIELEDRRKELADAQVARAQMHGMLREAERRLLEARHIIDLQREELASARVERERVAQSGRQLHSRLRQLEKLLSQGNRPAGLTGDMAPAAYTTRESAKEPTMPMQVSQGASSDSVLPTLTAEGFSIAERPGAMLEGQQDIRGRRTIVVREGETLWRLARRHKVGLEELRRINGLTSNRIVTGWTLRLPDSISPAGFTAVSPVEVKQ